MTDDSRKARLKALAERAGRTKEPADNTIGNSDGGKPGDGEDSGGEGGEEKSKKTKIAFRNYAPNDKSLNNPSLVKKPRTTPPSTVDQQNNVSALSSSDALKNALQAARQEEAVNANENHLEGRRRADDAVVVAADSNPTISTTIKKVNWDLKRDISHKIEKLERRTQKAIVEMLKERLESEAAKAVNDEDAGLE